MNNCRQLFPHGEAFYLTFQIFLEECLLVTEEILLVYTQFKES